MMVMQLETTLPVEVVSTTLPKNVNTQSRRGSCIAWWLDEHEHLWLVCFDETGEFVWVPMKEIRMQPSWTDNRRYHGVQDVHT
jgi:hypothetical protein